MQNPEHCDGSEKDMDQKTTEAKIQSQNDCMVVRICQEAYVEIQQSVKCVSAGHCRSFCNTSFCNSSECNNHGSEEDV